MIQQVNKTVGRLPFESVLELLKRELCNDGFEVGGITDFQNSSFGSKVTYGKYKILSTYHPFLYKEMMMVSPAEGAVLPCTISIVELYPGETAVIHFNPTENIAREMSLLSLENLAHEVGKRVDNVIHFLVAVKTKDPDLITSWS